MDTYIFNDNVNNKLLQEKQICDWPDSANCKVQKVTTSSTTSRTTTTDVAIIDAESEEVSPPSKPIIDIVDPNTKPELANSEF